MTKRMNWRTAALSSKRAVSVKDEGERFDRDPAARWLKKHEKWVARHGDQKPASRKPKS